MKKTYLLILFLFVSTPLFAQFGVSFNQSNLPFAGFSYELKNRLLPELRIGTDSYFGDTSLEIAINYIFKQDETVQAYAGIGGRIQIVEGVVIPVGLNIYPFAQKNFGFQMELTPILNEASLLRGSWGIRYRFAK